ncbi:MAG: CotH kinase family protein [Cyclobacteriaceae bacterium]
MKIYVLPLLLTAALTGFAQTDHWETVIKEGDEWRYHTPNEEPSANWTGIGFDDSGWSADFSGFGYGDNDDNTLIENVTSLYIRKEFEITNLATINEAIFHMDFDDAFVAYLNGTEIARAGISGNPPTADQLAESLHEASLHQGFAPDSYFLSEEIVADLLLEGTNALAVQVHNESSTSSDFTANPFFSVGIQDDTFTYHETPDWFRVPKVFTSSNLPIVVMNTNGISISDDPKIAADFGIIYNGVGVDNNITDPYHYSGVAGVEIRGETSAGFAKKSYGIEMWDRMSEDIDTSFLDFTPEEDFVLYGPYSDKSLLNNVLTMKLGRDLGHYASHTELVELVLNDEYQGLYVLMEKVKRGKGRVDIAKLNPEEIAEDDLTGGYIFRIDKGGKQGWISDYNVQGSGRFLRFQYYYPDQDDIAAEQKQYIQGYMDEFEDAIASSTYMNASGKHYTAYINLRSFVDNFIINEISKNVDGYRLSTYFNKDKDSKTGKVMAGPLWDFNLSYGNADYCNGSSTSGWGYYDCLSEDGSPFWWDKMLVDTTFTNALKCRWDDLRQTTLSTETIHNYLDSVANQIDDAQQRNFERWPVMGIYLWPNSSFYANSNSHQEVMGHMKNWLEARLNWLDQNMPGSAQHCETYENETSLPLVADGEAEEPIVEPTLGISDSYSNVLIFPNPSSGYLFVESGVSIDKVELFSLSGKKMLVTEGNAKVIRINFDSSIIDGIYFIHVYTQEGTSINKIRIVR